jgi:hypothetical protein
MTLAKKCVKRWEVQAALVGVPVDPEEVRAAVDITRAVVIDKGAGKVAE